MGCDGPVPPLATKVYVDCASVNTTATFTGVTSVVFSGDVDLKQNNVLLFPDATSIVVRGTLDLPKGRFVAPSASELFIGGGVVVANNSGLAVNTPTETSCTAGSRRRCGPRRRGWRSSAATPPSTSLVQRRCARPLCTSAARRPSPATQLQQVRSGGTCTSCCHAPRPRATSLTALSSP